MTETRSPLQQRTVHLVAHHEGARRSLTGFVIAAGTVLTCEHDIVDADRVEVRLAEDSRLLAARIAWRPDATAGLDVVVLAVPGLDATVHAPVGWGAIEGFTGAVEAFGFGYPAANRLGEADSADGGFHIAQLRGAIEPGEGHERGRLVFRFAPGQVPDEATWSGASGMAVFDSDRHLLLGVVSERLTGWHNRWDLTPAPAIKHATGLPGSLRRLPLRSVREANPLIGPAFPTRPVVSSSLTLLTARNGHVPYVQSSHQEPHWQLLDWCARSEERISISVLTGQAGAGKTRLAAELCMSLVRDMDTDWEAGFANVEAVDRWNVFTPERPTFVVFDYTDRRFARASLVAWLRHLAAEADRCPVIRVLLVNRHTGTWLEDLDTATDGITEELRRTGCDLDLREARAGAPGDAFDAERRGEHARAAYQSFRGTQADDPVPEDLLAFAADDRVTSPLLVHIAALLAARDEPLPHDEGHASTASEVQDRLLQLLLGRERRKHWDAHPDLSLSDAPPSGRDEAMHALAIVNLTQPDRADVETLLTASPLWKEASPADRRAATKALHALYPGPPRMDSDRQPIPTVAAMEPDLISEYLISLIGLDDLALIVKQLHSLELHGRYIDRMLHLAALTADHYEHISSVFDDTVYQFLQHAVDNGAASTATAPQILAARLEYLIKTALGKAADAGEQSMPNLLATALQRYGDHLAVAEGAAELEAEVPYPAPNRQTIELALRLESLSVSYFQRVGDEAGLAYHLNQLGLRLGALGRHHEAHPNLERAHRLFQSLSAKNSDHLPGLANSLNNLGRGLGELGRHREALLYLERAVGLYEVLAADNEAYRPDLAMSLNNLGGGHGELGRHREALSYFERAVGLWEVLAADNYAYRPDLAMSLSNLGMGLDALGRHREALSYFERAVGLWEVLAADNYARRPDLARSLNSLGGGLGELGRHREALPYFERVVGLWEVLAADNDAHRPGLAMSLSNLGMGLDALGRHRESLPYFERAVGLYEVLAADNYAHRPDLARSLNNLGGGLGELGRHREALPYFERVVGLYEVLAADNDAHRPDLAMSLNNLGVGLHELGRHRESLPYFERAAELYEVLAADNYAHRPNFAGSLINLGMGLHALGRHREALPYFERAVGLYEVLAADNDAHRLNLARSLNSLGLCQAQLAKLSEAHECLQRASKILGALSVDSPGRFDELFQQTTRSANALSSRLSKRNKARAAKQKRKGRK